MQLGLVAPSALLLCLTLVQARERSMVFLAPGLSSPSIMLEMKTSTLPVIGVPLKARGSQ